MVWNYPKKRCEENLGMWSNYKLVWAKYDSILVSLSSLGRRNRNNQVNKNEMEQVFDTLPKEM